MKQHWKKLGRVFCPSGEHSWMQTHAAVPIAEHIDENYFKIYFSTRDKDNKSYTSYIVLDITDPKTILDVCDKPILSPGEIGEFDDSGAMATWLTSYKGRKYLYYIGWNLGVTVPFRNSIGLAEKVDDKRFVRSFKGPIIDRTITEPHFNASCCVLVEDGKWMMWYLSCTNWDLKDGVPSHRYHIKYAESHNGVAWRRDGHVAIDYLNDKENAISRPSVIRDNDCWKMWFSSRGDSYRINYAESLDGYKWERKDSLVGIDISNEGWDSEMIEYPFVFDHDGRRYMLYNGNSYGETGFGLAVLEEA